MIKSYRTAQLLAQELLTQAQASEPQITADLRNIAEKVSAEMVGLEHKFKSEESLIRKLIDRSDFNRQSIYETAESINDAFRYTFILPFENYAESFLESVEVLQVINDKVPENLIWNAWQTAGKRFDKGYRGINTTIISSQNQKFELQFHTAESFQLKTDTHFFTKNLETEKLQKNENPKLLK